MMGTGSMFFTWPMRHGCAVWGIFLPRAVLPAAHMGAHLASLAGNGRTGVLPFPALADGGHEQCPLHAREAGGRRFCREGGPVLPDDVAPQNCRGMNLGNSASVFRRLWPTASVSGAGLFAGLRKIRGMAAFSLSLVTRCDPERYKRARRWRRCLPLPLF